MKEKIERYREIKEAALLGGGGDKLKQQHGKGKLGARERLDLLLDPGTFVELHLLAEMDKQRYGDGIVSGYGKIDGRTVMIFSQDPSVLGGSIGFQHGIKMHNTVERAIELGVPLIGLNDSPGYRIDRDPDSLGKLDVGDRKGRNTVFFPNTLASGVIPQISAILGPCAGVSVYSPALTDFILMVDGIAQMFLTGPPTAKKMLGEEVTMEDLGGSKVHSRVSGIADFRLSTEQECFEKIRKLMSFLPNNHMESPPISTCHDDPRRETPALEEILTPDSKKTYDMNKIIAEVVDEKDFLEVKSEFAKELIVGFGRLGGRPIGIVANQPMFLAGCLTNNASRKAARFIRFCDCFNIPLLFITDTPGYMPGLEQEVGGIICHGAKMLYAISESIVPKVTLVVRKSYGGGNIGMGVVKGLGIDLIFAWPTAEIGVMSAEAAVEVIYSKAIRDAKEPTIFEERKISELREAYSNPYAAASSQVIDDVIEPRETRKRLINAFEFLSSKKKTPFPKRHGNIPL
ncbi:MAG: acyl-CoA carboxylase subunit beta [Candidatus Aminicenantes bacterium]|nr:MAG: acyl-CoA carboxylase subunit beta [Candidatus Aminicenantes bacterium]